LRLGLLRKEKKLNRRIADRPTLKDLYIKVALPAIRWRIFFFSCHPFILLNGNKPAAAIHAGAQIPFFFFGANSAKDIKIYLKPASFSAMGTKFSWHLSPPFLKDYLQSPGYNVLIHHKS
jgi:hypothetical protein